MKWTLTTLFDLAAAHDHPFYWRVLREAQHAVLVDLDPRRGMLAFQRLDVLCDK